MSKARSEAADALRQLLAELESGELPESSFVQGHGIQSRVFKFEFNDETLLIDCDLPLMPLLSGEQTLDESNRRVEAAVRVCILLLSLAGEVAGGEQTETGAVPATAMFSCDARGLAFAFKDAMGEAVHSGDSWEALAAALASLSDSSSQGLEILWP